MEKMLQFQEISYQKKNRILIDRFDFALNAGEVHAIMSSRSFDLTSFSNLILGEYAIDDDIWFMGKKHPYKHIKSLSYSVNPGNGLIAEFSVAQNLFINSTFSMKTAVNKTQEVFDWLGITISPKGKTKYLSDSQCKILEIIRGYTMNMPIIMLCDSLYYIDNDMQRQAMFIIRKLAEKGMGILYLTSKLEDAMRISDRISVVERGSLIGTFNTDAVRASPRQMMRLIAGLDIDNSDDQETIETIGAIVATRNIVDSSTELHAKIRQIADNILRFVKADYCTIFINSSNGRKIMISKPEEHVFPEDMLQKIGSSLQKMTVYNDPDLLGQANGPLRTLVCLPIHDGSSFSAIGVLTVGYKEATPITQKTEILLSAIVKDISITLETSVLQTRSLLLRESNHRIKNNLQMIISLLYMQKHNLSKIGNITPETVNMIIDDIVTRVRSIALVHEILTVNGENNDSIILLETLISGVVRLYSNADVDIRISVEKIALKYDRAVFIALMVNEMINNCIKHAFVSQQDEPGRIDITCKMHESCLEVITQDNGIGIDPEQVFQQKKGSVGIQIINLAVESLDGDIEYKNDHGTCVRVRIPKENLL